MSQVVHPLITHIQKITSSREIGEGEEILSYFDARSYRKKDILQEEEKFCASYFFVVKGCLRLFFTGDNIWLLCIM